MKIEKITDNQIRCTLTSEDLESRDIRLSELAYGSEKAKRLFRDMMRQAYLKFGFHADNIPLMIEAVPEGPGSITLLITKVEDPEELDTRFARLTPSRDGKGANTPQVEDADDIINMVRKMYEAKQKAQTPDPDAESRTPPGTGTFSPSHKVTGHPGKGSRPRNNASSAMPSDQPVDFVRLYRFLTLDRVIEAACALQGSYNGDNTLFRTEGSTPYVLIIHKSAHTPEEFNRVCNILSEYGTSEACTSAKEAHLTEHKKKIISGHALQDLGKL